MSGNFFFPLAKHRETITGAKISHLKSSVRLTAAAGEGDLHALVLIGDAMPSHCTCGRRVSHKGNNCKRCATELGIACDPHGNAKKLNDEHYKKRKASGALKESYDKYNPINNPINAAKRKVALRLKAEEYALSNGTDVQTEELRENVIDAIMSEDRPELGGKSLTDCVNNPDFSFYIGGTFRALKEEDLRWLTARGAAKFDDDGVIIEGTEKLKNRSVLLLGNGDNVKMKQARDEFGFRSIVVFENRLHLNASRIEDKLQGRYQSLPLGCPRLWRCRGKGAKYSEEEEKVHKVFITYSFKVRKAVEVGKLIIQE